MKTTDTPPVRKKVAGTLRVPWQRTAHGVCLLLCVLTGMVTRGAEPERGRLRVLIETDAGGDPDDEQSLVRFLLYANEWDIEGIIANRPKARDKENLNPERTGLGIVRRLVQAYGECYPNLVQHDARYPKPELLLARTVAGYEDNDDGVKLLLAAVDGKDPRPVWFCNWGTDKGSAASSLKRALDRVLKERSQEGYAAFKSRLRLSSADKFGEHMTREPPFKLWVDTFRPELDKKRWYHRFSALTATAGGFDLKRDVLTGHGPLGALYPTNTTHAQKEGDTMSFLYLVPTGMNDSEQPTWGSWAGRYGLNPEFRGKPYYWANQADAWQGTTHRDNTLKRWAADLQNDFGARLDWCVKPLREANHPPVVVVNGKAGKDILHLTVAGTLRVPLPAAADGTRSVPATVKLTAAGSSDPDGQELSYQWFVYPEAGTYPGEAAIVGADSPEARVQIPADAAGKTIHVVLAVRDQGVPPLARYRRVVIACEVSGQVGEKKPKELVQQVVKTAGGEDKLLKLFRIRERLNVSADPKKEGKERISVLEPPNFWWLGKRERVKDEKEPATFLVWAWTLGALVDPKSKVEVIAEVHESEKPAFGLRVSGTITPPMDLYFDKAENRLVRIDWRQDIHRFSDWKEHDGVNYPARCVGYKKATGKPWYFSAMLELERLTDLPDGLKR